MGLMRQYVGKYVTATSASTKIDATAIIKVCNAVDNDANEITRLANLFKSEAARIDKTSLSIDNKTMEENVDECSAGIEERRKAILDATDYIRQVTEDIYNQIQSQYNENAKERDRAIQAQKNRQSKG